MQASGELLAACLVQPRHKSRRHILLQIHSGFTAEITRASLTSSREGKGNDNNFLPVFP